MEIQYEASNAKGLDLVEPLWQRLNQYHLERSRHFSHHYATRTFAARKAEMLNKSKGGFLRTDLARDSETESLIGYCLSTIAEDGLAEIGSIYVEPDYRRAGIGHNLAARALQWMDDAEAKRKVLSVAAGNEDVFAFYSRYGFYPRSIVLEQVDKV